MMKSSSHTLRVQILDREGECNERFVNVSLFYDGELEDNS